MSQRTAHIFEDLIYILDSFFFFFPHAGTHHYLKQGLRDSGCSLGEGMLMQKASLHPDDILAIRKNSVPLVC